MAEARSTTTRPRADRAYVVTSRESPDDGSVVVFARTVREARKHAYLDGVEYIDLVARHEPAFDQYAPGPVPIAAMLAEGWHFECGGCYRTLREGSEPGMIVREHDVFCGERCEAKELGRAAGAGLARAERVAAQAEAERRFPGAKVVSCAMLCRAYLGSDYDPVNRRQVSRYEPWPEDGARIRVRLHDAARDAYASWSPGDVAAAVLWEGARDAG